MTIRRPSRASPAADPGRQVAQLREALRLVEQISGRRGEAGAMSSSTRRRGSATPYDRALPIAPAPLRRARWRDRGLGRGRVEALLAAGADGAAARRRAARRPARPRSAN